jgi:hypothetical protein
VNQAVEVGLDQQAAAMQARPSWITGVPMMWFRSARPPSGDFFGLQSKCRG